jgi:hypothetical protein
MYVLASLLPLLCPGVRVLKSQEDGGVALLVRPRQPRCDEDSLSLGTGRTEVPSLRTLLVSTTLQGVCI